MKNHLIILVDSKSTNHPTQHPSSREFHNSPFSLFCSISLFFHSSASLTLTFPTLVPSYSNPFLQFSVTVSRSDYPLSVIRYQKSIRVFRCYNTRRTTRRCSRLSFEDFVAAVQRGSIWIGIRTTAYWLAVFDCVGFDYRRNKQILLLFLFGSIPQQTLVTVAMASRSFWFHRALLHRIRIRLFLSLNKEIGWLDRNCTRNLISLDSEFLNEDEASENCWRILEVNLIVVAIGSICSIFTLV